MISKVTASFINLLLYSMLSMLCLSSCNLNDTGQSDNTRYQPAFRVAAYKIRLYNNSMPDSVIKYADKAISILQNMQSGNTDTLISIMHVKADAFLSKEDAGLIFTNPGKSQANSHPRI
ncbi:MAG: hypothetical protein WCJ95_20470 [Mariniphaga sp.]